VCSSNVRVHQEVRDWKAVVDPGCMKCLDCVSVCPKDALYVGWGAPSLFAAGGKTAPRRELGERLARIALATVFAWASFALLMWHGGELRAGFALATAVASIAVAVVFAGKSARSGGPSFGEEVLLGAGFLASLYAFRGVPVLPGLPDVVPLLLSVGMAAISAYFALLAARAARKSNVSLQNLELVRGGRPTRAGYGFAALVLPLALLWVRGGWLQLSYDRDLAARRDGEALEREREAHELALARAAYDRGVAQARAGSVDAAIAEFEEAVRRAPRFREARENLAGMLCQARRFTEGIAHYTEALRQQPDDADTRVLLGRAYAENGDLRSAEEQWNTALRIRPDHAAAHLALAILCDERGDSEGARAHREAAARAEPPR
jgi:tetratricopeptide (TPR) repeat protein